VTYVLQSVEPRDENAIRLVAVQAVHFKRSFGPVSLGDRKIAKTQHRVLMIREGGSWQISELEEGVTEISSLRDAFRTEIDPAPRSWFR
jgi:hypothetical protein